jgi:hypothetical protein
MGTSKDMQDRVDLRREDGRDVQARIQQARDRVYKDGILPGSTALDGKDLLISGLTSTRVSSMDFARSYTDWYTERVFKSLVRGQGQPV